MKNPKPKAPTTSPFQLLIQESAQNISIHSFDDAPTFFAIYKDGNYPSILLTEKHPGDTERQTLARVCTNSPSIAWDDVRRAIYKRSRIYMTGDCWHFALALHRLYDADIYSIRRSCQKDPTNQADHVVGRLKTGHYIDANGIYPTKEQLFERYQEFLQNSYGIPTTHIEIGSFKKIHPAEVETALDFFHKLDSKTKAPKWQDISEYPFAAETEAFIKICFQDVLATIEANPYPRN
jgi:hypothetical protein